MAAQAAGRPEVIRRPVRAATGAAALAVVVLCLVAAIVTVDHPGDNVVGIALAGMLLAAALYTTVGMLRSGVVVTRDALIVRNTWRIHRIAWHEVLFISPASDDPAFRAVGVVTVGGGRVRCHALGAMRWERTSDPRFQSLYDRLDAHLKVARADGRCGVDS